MKTGLRWTFREKIMVITSRGSRIWPPVTCKPRKMDSSTLWTAGLQLVCFQTFSNVRQHTLPEKYKRAGLSEGSDIGALNYERCEACQ